MKEQTRGISEKVFHPGRRKSSAKAPRQKRSSKDAILTTARMSEEESRKKGQRGEHGQATLELQQVSVRRATQANQMREQDCSDGRQQTMEG